MTTAQWTCKTVLDWTSQYLQKQGDEHPRLSAEWLLSAVTGLSRVELYVHFDKPLTPLELKNMHTAIERRSQGEPLQYVTGEMPFRHIIVRCSAEVLIPRPETETLVDLVLSALPKDRAALLLEVGTGSGCIACSLAKERPKTHVVATDISSHAVSLAKRNAQALGLQKLVDIVECDCADAVDKNLWGHFDALVSNPPYIPSSVLPSLPEEVKGFEPHLALDGGKDGLDIFRRLLELAPDLLLDGGFFAVELFEETLDDARVLMEKQRIWVHPTIHLDLTGRPRFLTAYKDKA